VRVYKRFRLSDYSFISDFPRKQFYQHVNERVICSGGVTRPLKVYSFIRPNPEPKLLRFGFFLLPLGQSQRIKSKTAIVIGTTSHGFLSIASSAA